MKQSSNNIINYKLVLDNTPSSIFILNLDGIICYSNNANARLFGFQTPDDINGKNIKDFFSNNFIQELNENIIKHHQKSLWKGETKAVKADGTLIDVGITVQMQQSTNSTGNEIFAILADITEKKYNAEKLIASEKTFRDLFENSSDVILMLDTYGKIIDLNNKTTDLTRYTKNELLSMNIMDIIIPEDHEMVKDAINDVLQGKTHTCDVHWISKDGSIITFKGNTSPRFSPEGEIIYIRCILHDVSEEKEIENTLRASEHKHRALIQNLNALIFKTDTDLKTVGIAGKLRGLPIKTPKNHENNPYLWKELVHPDDLPNIMKKIDQSMTDKEPFTVEFRTSKYNWLRGHITPEFDKDGNFTGLDGVYLDITDLIEARIESSKHSSRMKTLANISKIFTETLDIKTIYSSAVSEISKSLKCLCAIIDIEPNTGIMKFIAIDSNDQAFEKRFLTAFQDEIFAIKDISDFKMLVTDQFETNTEQLISFASATNIGPYMRIPIYINNTPVFFIALAREKGCLPFDKEDLWFMNEIASHVTSAFTNAKLFQQQSQIAETLQKSLLPSCKSVSGLDIATYYCPAENEVSVGGDFFDIIDFKNGEIGIVVGDVSGKGIDAAVHTAEAKYMLRGFALQNNDPGFVISALNNGLYAFTEEDTFVTLIYALINLKKKTICYVNAGHEIPIVIDLNNTILSELKPTGPILGIIKEKKYSTKTIDLEDNFCIIMYTDGIIDISNKGTWFTYEMFLKHLKDSTNKCLGDGISSCKAKCILDNLIKAVVAFGENHQSDDQLLIIITPDE